MSKNKTFVLNDESVINSYGFCVLNDGIDLERFKANPVMLDQHWNSTSHVIGNWQNLRIEGSKLLADSNFDTQDKDAKKIEGKVDRGFIKGASIGISFNYAFVERNPDDTYVLTSCELFEASIVAIPSNANAVTLFAENGAKLSTDEVRLSLSQLTNSQTPNFKQKSKQMEKVTLSAGAIMALAAVGINQDDPNAISKGIEQLSASLKTANETIDTLKNDKSELQGKLTKQNDDAAEALIAQAKLEGKITAEEEGDYLKDAKANYTLTAKLIGKIPAKKTLSGEVIPTSVGGNSTDPKNIDEFEKLSLSAQLKFKTENPDAYTKLFS